MNTPKHPDRRTPMKLRPGQKIAIRNTLVAEMIIG